MKRTERGFALLSVLAVTAGLLIAGAATIQLVRSQLHFTANEVAAQTAYHVSEAGIQRGLAQLDNDAATAATPGYVHPTIPTASFGGGTYTVTLAQDPLFATDLTRKLITSTGTFNGQQATLVAHALVQPPADPCAQYLVMAEGGDARILSKVSALTTLFNRNAGTANGEIFSNNDVEMSMLAGAAFNGYGDVYARDDFRDTSVVSLLSTVNARLFRGGDYDAAPIHLHVPILNTPLTGLHFSNGSSGHGQSSTIAARTLPVPDWETAKRNATYLVNSETYSTVVPGSAWTNGTWVVNTFSVTPGASYYVDGNVNVVGLQLLGGSSSEIWARGLIGVNKLSLLAIGGTQTIKLIGERDVAIGRALNGALTALVDESAALTSIVDGVSLGSTGVGALTRTNVVLYSQKGEAWAMSTTAAALSDTRACLLSHAGNSTLAFTVAIGSSVQRVR